MVHVAASPDGAPYAFGWQNGNGDLVIVDGRAKAVRRVTKSEMPKWLGDGLRWDSVTIKNGAIRFLVPGSRPGVIQITPDNEVASVSLYGQMGAIGPLGLLVTPEGTVRETIDAGLSYRDVAPPPGLSSKDDRLSCVAAGCTIGPWHRVGWGP